VWALAADWRRGLLLVSFFVPFFLFIANTVPMSRYLSPVLPMAALAAGYAIVRAGRAMRAAGRAAPAVLTALCLVPGFLASVEWDRFLEIADTRTLAGDFITSNIPSGRSMLVQPYGPPLRQSREGLIEGLRANLGTEAKASPKFQHMLALNPYPEPSYRLLYLGDNGHDMEKVYVLPQEFSGGAGLEPLRRRGIQYVVLKQGNQPNPEIRNLEAALAREATRIAEFSPYRPDATAQERASVQPFLHNTAAVVHPALERPGPIIEVWQVNGSPPDRDPAQVAPR
jgi:hypothetical protein